MFMLGNIAAKVFPMLLSILLPLTANLAKSPMSAFLTACRWYSVHPDNLLTRADNHAQSILTVHRTHRSNHLNTGLVSCAFPCIAGVRLVDLPCSAISATSTAPISVRQPQSLMPKPQA